MVNESKKSDQRFWDKWKKSGAIGNVNGKDFGEAYAFFNCNASKNEIEQTIPRIRELVNTPRRLELCLAERSLPILQKKVDSELLEIALEAKEAGIRYVLAARSPSNITNRQTADELSAILNQAYQSSLYQNGEPFVGEIVYKEDGRYVYRE